MQQTLCDRAAGRERKAGQGARPAEATCRRPGEQGGLFPPPARPTPSVTRSSGVGPDPCPVPGQPSRGSGAGVLVGWKRTSYSHGEGAGAGSGQKAAGQARLAALPRPADSHRLLCCSPDPVGGPCADPEETVAGTRLGPGWCLVVVGGVEPCTGSPLQGQLVSHIDGAQSLEMN